MQAKDLALAKGPVLQVPVDLGGIAISYNIPGVPTGLKLDGPTLATILDGTIENWDSPIIATETGDDHLPNMPIVVVHRADSAGPSWDVDDYLIQTAPSWVQIIGTKSPSKTWPITGYGLGEQLNSGVATYIAQTPGAIGYVEYGYALKANFTNAAVLNSSGAVRRALRCRHWLRWELCAEPEPQQFLDHQRTGFSYLPNCQFQLDIAVPEAVEHDRGRGFAEAVQLCRHDGPDHGWQPRLRSSARQCRFYCPGDAEATRNVVG